MSKKKQSVSEVSEDLKPKASIKPAPSKVSKESDTKVVQDKAKSTKVTEQNPEQKENLKAADSSKSGTKKDIASVKAELARVKVTQIGSSIGRKNDQERTLTGLGLGKIGRSRILESTPSVHGMINKVQHLIKVEAA